MTLEESLSSLTSEQKVAYLYRTQEKLRLAHNEKGKDFRDGKISKAEWQEFLENWFNPKSNKISEHLGELKETLKASKTYDAGINLEEI